MNARFHWLAVTFRCGFDVWQDLVYTGWMRELFGELVPVAHGGRGYRKISTGLVGFQIYSDPIQASLGTHVHMVLPGDACDACLPGNMIDFWSWLMDQPIGYHVTRLDVAVDNVPFDPLEFYQAVKENRFTSLAKRESVVFTTSPFEFQDGQPGKISCSTCYLGSRQSDRFVRVYDKRGYTRLEMQCGGDRAGVIADRLFSTDYQNWNKEVISHIRQFVEVRSTWWESFVMGTDRADIRISQPRVMSAKSLDLWMKGQVSAALYTLNEVTDGEYKQELIDRGKENIERQRKKNGISRYDHLLSLVGS